jgi:hypothetical protein
LTLQQQVQKIMPQNVGHQQLPADKFRSKRSESVVTQRPNESRNGQRTESEPTKQPPLVPKLKTNQVLKYKQQSTLDVNEDFTSPMKINQKQVRIPSNQNINLSAENKKKLKVI